MLDPVANQIPSSAGPFKIKDVKNVRLKVPLPANATYNTVTLTEGSGLNGTPTATIQGTTIVITIHGSVAGGATIKLPTITLELTAGQSGTIESRLGGASYDDPGLAFDTPVKVGPFTQTAAVACYPDPNPVLTTTTITSP